LFERIDACIDDPRVPEQIIYSQRDLITQRIFAIASGYEDVNDHASFRQDAVLQAVVKEQTSTEASLGSPSTLSRLENRITAQENRKLQELLVEFFIESFANFPAPAELILDFDATNDSVHGKALCV
jgi:hypothetical protein